MYKRSQRATRALVRPKPRKALTYMQPSKPATFVHTRTTHPTDRAARETVLANPGFGKYYSDHMVAIDWDAEHDWHGARVTPYAPLTLDPASLVLHYAQ